MYKLCINQQETYSEIRSIRQPTHSCTNSFRPAVAKTVEIALQAIWFILKEKQPFFCLETEILTALYIQSHQS